MTRGSTATALEAVARPYRVRWVGVAVLVAFATLAAVLAAAVWGARAGLLRSPLWVPVAWFAGVAAALVAGARAARVARSFSAADIATRLEASPGWRAGALRALLGPPAAGTSELLYRAADALAAEGLEFRAASVLAPERRQGTRWLVAGSLLLGLGALLTGTGARKGPGALLWQPADALAMAASPLTIAATRSPVSAGDSVILSIGARGRTEVTLWTRAPGSRWEPTPVALDAAGRARRTVGPLVESLFAHVTAGSRSSDTIEVTVRRPAFLVSLALMLRYPAYLGLEDEPVQVGGDTLLLPIGTLIEVRGAATVPLASASWEREGARSELKVETSRFSGSLTPRSSGAWRLALRTEGGEPLAGDELTLTLRVIPDAAPAVEIPVPAGDTTAPLAGSLPLVVDARDDHGLREVVLERRVAQAGQTHRLRDEPLPLPGELPDRVMLPGAVDPRALGLLPGDTLYVTARARDNSPTGQVGRSRERAIAVPTRPEQRATEREAAQAVQRRLDSLAAEAREAQRQTEDLGRTQPRGNEQSLDFDAARKAEAVAARQEAMLRQAEEVARALEQLTEGAERAGLADSAFMKALQEVRAQLDQALDPELRRQLAALQEALRSLDRNRVQEAVQRLGEQQQKLKEALERSRDLFKRAALEGQLAALEQESREVTEAQREWNAELSRTDSATAAGRERSVASRADSVAAGLERAARQLDSASRREGMRQAAESARDAAREMRAAAGAAERRQAEAARQAGEAAAGKMQQAGDQVQQQRQGQQQEWREEVVRQLDRALLETTRLAERQLQVSEQFQRGSSLPGPRAAQGTLEESAQKLLEQVMAVAGKNALVSPQIMAALAEARQQMQRAREASASASGSPREPAERAGDAVDALNVAAYGLLRSRDEVAGSSSGSGFAEAMERMTRLANQQGQLSQDANGLLPMAGAAGIQQQLQALAARQRALAQELERLRAQGQPNAKPMGDEAADLARSLERGRIDRELVARQERLFRRMLDAGRTLTGREEDERKERQSETARPGELRLPPALLSRLQGRDGEIRLPTWDALRKLSPEERRIVTDYFRRLTGGVP